MEEKSWQEMLDGMCREDRWYQQWLERAKELEPAYEQIREKLPEEQNQILDQYIMACEEMDYVRQLLAYQLGRNHG